MKILCLVGLILMSINGALTSASAETRQNFDVTDGGTPYVDANCVPEPGKPPPEIIEGGPTGVGNFLRLAGITAVPIQNTISFDRTDEGAFHQIVAEFDFRISLTPGFGRADGLGFALLNTEVHGNSGLVCPVNNPFASEEPNFVRSLGVGFDIFDNPVIPGDINANHISIHFNNAVVTECVTDVTGFVDLANGQWMHAQITIRPGSDLSVVSVELTPPEATESQTVIDNCPVPGLEPYEGRVFFGARSGGERADFDLDNIVVQFEGPEPPVAHAGPDQGVPEGVLVTLDGSRSTAPEGRTLTYSWVAPPGIVLANADTANPSFTAPEVTEVETLSFELVVSDGEEESQPDQVNVIVGKPSAIGQWGNVFEANVVPVHLILLPTGKVLYWEEGEEEHLTEPELAKLFVWDPETGIISKPAIPSWDAFCTGHSFLEDGSLLVTGGHDGVDGVGLPNAGRYDPFADQWTDLPSMGPLDEHRRWYPTNTTLANGDVLVLSGSINTEFVENRLPQVWERQLGTWRDLTAARDQTAALPDEDHPLGSRFVLYPRTFLAPNGLVFKADANPNQVTWFLDTEGLGQWIMGPTANFAGEGVSDLKGSREYGAAVYYERGQVMIIGGGDPPTASVEIIDLNAETLTWQSAQPMAYTRRYLNTVVLPDGKVLAVGGTSSPMFNDATDAVLIAEMMDPRPDPLSAVWVPMASMALPRVYHSTAILLPDGRVLVGGGGRPAPGGPPPHGGVDQKNFEIYSPPYLFAGERPVIGAMPDTIGYGQDIQIDTADGADITLVSFIRLPAVTHAFDQNMRMITLDFMTTPSGLQVASPSSPFLAPPGHYMLFILNSAGVPSVARIVRLTHDLDGDNVQHMRAMPHHNKTKHPHNHH